MRALIEALARMPGLGPKSAQRIVLWMLRQPKKTADELARLLSTLHGVTVHCTTCFMATEEPVHGQCAICRDPRRDGSLLCVLASSVDIAQIEETHEYHGRYHVLGGTLSPLEGVTPDTLTVAALMKRLAKTKQSVNEVILAFDQNVEGETTVLYLKNALKEGSNSGLKISRLARGLPTNSELEYADPVTLANAMKERRAI